MNGDSPIEWRDGQPWSRRHGDVYFARAGGIGQSRHVFLAGNGLPERFGALGAGEWFTIGETGFGTGLGLLCAWQAFARAAPAAARLHFISTERDPLPRDDLSRAHEAWPELARASGQLRDRLGRPARGWHRIALDGGRVVLTLLVGDARETLPELDATVDAWFLDGFAPDRNPELWSPELMGVVSSLSRTGTTVATWSSAGTVRRALESAGFEVWRAPGFAAKREMTAGRCVAPRARDRAAPWLSRPAPAAPRSAVVVGGGLAGTSAAASLAARGVAVTLVERHETLAAGASGNAQGVLYAKLSPHGTALSRLLADGLQYTLRELAARLPQDGVAWSRCGVLQMPEDAADARRQALLAEQDWPPSLLRAVDAAEAATRAAMPVASGGLWFGESGWAHPPALCAALAATPGVRVVTRTQALALQPASGGEGWSVHAAGAASLEADMVVIANAADARDFAPAAWMPLSVIRGQLTHLPATRASRALRAVLCRDGYVAPARNGEHCAGASFVIRDAATGLRAGEHAENLARLESLSPAFARAVGAACLDVATLAGRAALRCVTPDHLPLAGALADADAFGARYAALAKDATTRFDGEAPWLPGLFCTLAHGSRGLLTAPLCGELVAALALGEPLPVAAAVMRALAPARFMARSLSRGRPRRDELTAGA
jgi:tRNA 5-methylaminomethyl-2-thiouridine biosynthesis bifunctional protein